MVDLYFVTSIINIIWYIFSILFVLYRFTSFFSYIYGFLKFSAKFLQGFVYIKDQILLFIERRRGQYVERSRPDSIFTRLKKAFHYIFDYTNTTVLPVYDVRCSYSELNEVTPTHQSIQDRTLFDQHIYSALTEDSHLMHNASNGFTSIDIHNQHHTQHHPHPHTNNPVDSNMLLDSSFIQAQIGSRPIA